MFKYASLIRENGERLRWLDTVVSGKDAAFGSFEVAFAADTLECKQVTPRNSSPHQGN